MQCLPKGGDIGIYGMAVLAYFSYGISVFSLKNGGITILEILRYTVFAILDSKTAVIDKICLRYYGIEYPPMPPSLNKLMVAELLYNLCDNAVHIYLAHVINEYWESMACFAVTFH
jgi:hypothetical protein